jgi:hypothetical protein
MGELSDTLKEFHDVSSAYYKKIMNILEDEYCWKCPMRSTSGTALCREVHAWCKIEEVLEEGVMDNLLVNSFSSLEVEALAARVRAKMIKKNGGELKELTITMKVNEYQNVIKSKSVLYVKINPKRVQVGDKVLIPLKSFKFPLIINCALIAGFPFQLEAVEKFFHEGGVRYVKTVEGVILPLTSVYGVLMKEIKPKDANYPEL